MSWRSLRPDEPLRYFTQFNRNAKLFLLSTVVGGIAFAGFQLFFNIFLRRRGYDLDFVGLLNAVPAGAGLLTGIPLGIAYDRIGRRRAMLIGVTVATATAWALVSAQSRGMMVILSAALGLGNTLYFLSQAPFMMSASGARERTLLFSLNFGLMTLSGAAGNLLAGQLPGWFGSWLGVGAESPAAYQAVLVASILGGGFALIPLWLIREGRIAENGRRPAIGLEGFRELLRPGVLRLTVPNFIIGLGAALLIPYLNLFYKSKFSIDDGQLGLLFSLSAIVTGGATVFAPQVAARLGGKVKAVVVTQASSLFFLLAIGFAPRYWISGLAFLFRGALMNMSAPLYSAFAMEQTPEHERGAVNSVMELTWQIGWTIGPYLSGLAQARYGFAPLFVTTTLLYGAGATITYLFFHQSETQTATAAAATL
ncbi:MAG: MFS transporter [Chloroflexi bacterium]|nr:MFS transporter [Chloroflexota bacterium]